MKGKKEKILGIDPGTNCLGFAILERQGDLVVVKDMGEIHLKKYANQQEKLREIYLQLQEIIELHLPDCMAIEAPFFGKNAQSMLKLGRAQGVAIAAGIMMGLEITEYAPRKIKQAVTGNGNASKEQVSSMLMQLLKIKITETSHDASDALAVAFCHHLQAGIDKPMKKYSSWKKFISDNPGSVKSL